MGSYWSTVSHILTFGRVTNILMVFGGTDGFNGTTAVKQADVVLLTYPLEYEQPTEQALQDLDFYALATSPSGESLLLPLQAILLTNWQVPG